MQIIKNRQIIDSPWRLEEPDSSVTTRLTDDKTHTLVSLSRWMEAGEAVKSSGAIGVYLQPADEVVSLADNLDAVPIIALIFSSFSEGRGYSQAIELREQHYQNEIRAIGATVDNLSFMERCGINAFQLLDEDVDLEQALSFFTDIDTVYPYN